ncbi:hypothetical protein L218DRAFT_998531 [Marasmius fiardii PR-910]|nr:hypothetical protein L218DRAFT_998531 [Marasmius fiardii PR-910]
MDLRTQRSASHYRTRFHPYRRLHIPFEDQDKPYEPRVKDNSLLYLVFDVPSLSSQNPTVEPLEAENHLNNRDADELGFWDLGLAVFMLIFLQHLLMFALLQRGGRNDGA